MAENADTPPDYYDPLDLDYMEDLMAVWQPVAKDYFRPRLLGAHRIPKTGPVIIAPNHSGNAFPYDGMVLDWLLWLNGGADRKAKFRSVFERELATTWWMRPFGIDNFWRRGGGIDITFDNFDTLMARGERIIYYPEGVPGIGKGFNNRYNLQRFSTSYIIMAARHKVPVMPTYIINAEWVVPFSYTFRPVNWIMQKVFGVPFLPLPAGPLALLLPWAWYLALPTRMIFVIGEPIDVAALVEEAGVQDLYDLDTEDRARVRQVADQVRDACQVDLDRYVERYGRWPYQGRSLRKSLRRFRGRLSHLLPWGWPWRFVRHHRDRMRPPARNRFHAWLRDWDLIGFYLPFGWAILSLARWVRKPPCGYRGLPKKVKKEIQGEFIWKLDERPLPPKS